MFVRDRKLVARLTRVQRRGVRGRSTLVTVTINVGMDDCNARPRPSGHPYY